MGYFSITKWTTFQLLFTGLKNAFLKNLDNSEKVDVYPFQQGQSDFKTILSKIKQKKNDVIYLIAYEEMVAIFKQAQEMNITCQWLGNNQMNDPAMVRKFEQSANGTIFPGFHFDIDSIKTEYSKFYSKYLEYSGGLELDHFAAYGVDALIAINQALLNGAKSGEEIKNDLYKIPQIKGISGSFSFDDNGDPIRQIDLYKIENGVIIKLQ